MNVHNLFKPENILEIHDASGNSFSLIATFSDKNLDGETLIKTEVNSIEDLYMYLNYLILDLKDLIIINIYIKVDNIQELFKWTTWNLSTIQALKELFYIFLDNKKFIIPDEDDETDSNLVITCASGVVKLTTYLE